ncbi:hypothetical protein SAMN02927914_01391 [Mesorhizobium qingshengii]|uniref:Uncharacterized protein n=1 Tax=Mesorhizobium qingshengii TaxID=1165689 RepID=A0A1G5WJN2_9HYPH|nr:hypothetical protein SAMN02927914_01391 [Mesorhizobium qingshengii]
MSSVLSTYTRAEMNQFPCLGKQMDALGVYGLSYKVQYRVSARRTFNLSDSFEYLFREGKAPGLAAAKGIPDFCFVQQAAFQQICDGLIDATASKPGLGRDSGQGQGLVVDMHAVEHAHQSDLL